MKSFGEIIKELGFNPEASEETQKAFFKHMAMMADAKTLKSQPITPTKKAPPVQMEFDLSISNGPDKKVS